MADKEANKGSDTEFNSDKDDKDPLLCWYEDTDTNKAVANEAYPDAKAAPVVNSALKVVDDSIVQRRVSFTESDPVMIGDRTNLRPGLARQLGQKNSNQPAMPSAREQELERRVQDL